MSKAGLMIVVCDETTRTLQAVRIKAVFNLFSQVIVNVVTTQIQSGEVSVVAHLTFWKELMVLEQILIETDGVRSFGMTCTNVENKLYMFRHREITLWTPDQLDLGHDSVIARLEWCYLMLVG